MPARRGGVASAESRSWERAAGRPRAPAPTLPFHHARAKLAPMVRILWSFTVAAQREQEFVRAYGPAGDWASLFAEAEGYRGTKLLRELSGSLRYLTEDTWETAADFDRFTAAHRVRYDELDARCQALTIDESLIGIFEEWD